MTDKYEERKVIVDKWGKKIILCKGIEIPKPDTKSRRIYRIGLRLNQFWLERMNSVKRF